MAGHHFFIERTISAAFIAVAADSSSYSQKIPSSSVTQISQFSYAAFRGVSSLYSMIETPLHPNIYIRREPRNPRGVNALLHDPRGSRRNLFRPDILAYLPEYHAYSRIFTPFLQSQKRRDKKRYSQILFNNITAIELVQIRIALTSFENLLKN